MSAASDSRERLYALLPAIQRIRDSAEGEPLRALLGVVETELKRVQDNIAALHDNWFIETCDEWVVPYLGDLLAVRGLRPVPPATSLRPYVANTLGYRRRKGTAAMLEGLARDVTGWRARAVEFFQLLATTQHLNHLRPANLRTPDLRDTEALERLYGPFEEQGHFAEVRRIGTGGGKYNLPNVGLFLWRLTAFEIAAPAVAASLGGGRFRFSQLGHDLPLFNPARTPDPSRGGRAEETDLPGALRRRPLFDELRAARASLADGATPDYAWFDAAEPVFRITPLGGSAIPRQQIQICDLSDWTNLPPAESVALPDGSTLTARVVVDPVLGRFAFVSGAVPAAVEVDYRYGFSASLGGGPYDRVLDEVGSRTLYSIAVADPTQPVDAALSDALTKWATVDGRPDAVFEINDSGRYGVVDLSLLAAGNVTLRAADGARPTLVLAAPWQVTLAERATLSIGGLLISGEGMEIKTTSSGDDLDHTVTLDDCTLVPGQRLDEAGAPLVPDGKSLGVRGGSAGRLTVRLRKSICGRIDLTPAGGAAAFASDLEVSDTIIDGSGGTHAALQAGALLLARATVLGSTRATTIEASEAIFTGRVIVERTQVGCVRFSFVAANSKVPRCYHCQPALAIAAAPAAESDLVRDRLVPAFTSLRYGSPGYAQLGAACPAEIAAGAEDGSEMGAFQLLHQPQRYANLRASLDEYLRFGLEAGFFSVT